jgi:ABC-type dipeptide/oligopeptide/nickel transport system permease component
MPGLIFNRLLDAIPTIFLVLTLVFIALRLLPGDPALVALGDQATAQQLELFREQTGLNVPVWQQYFTFLWDMVTLNLGRSLISGAWVVNTIARNLPYTIELTIVATGIGALLGIPFGVWAAVRKNRAPDQGMRVFSLVGYAVPDFYLGAMLLIVFALNLAWFPINGGGEGFLDRMYHIALPAITLAFVKVAFLGRLTRTSLLEVLSKDYVRTARAKGVKEKTVLLVHVLRNSLIPVVTVIALGVPTIFSGAIITEQIFRVNGLGQLLITAIQGADIPLVQTLTFIFAVLIVLFNLIADVLYGILDPRIRYD